jgi:hypothetical protein
LNYYNNSKNKTPYPIPLKRGQGVRVGKLGPFGPEPGPWTWVEGWKIKKKKILSLVKKYISIKHKLLLNIIIII